METNLHRVFCVTGRGLNGDIEPKKIVYIHRQHNEFKKKITHEERNCQPSFYRYNYGVRHCAQ